MSETTFINQLCKTQKEKTGLCMANKVICDSIKLLISFIRLNNCEAFRHEKIIYMGGGGEKPDWLHKAAPKPSPLLPSPSGPLLPQRCFLLMGQFFCLC